MQVQSFGGLLFFRFLYTTYLGLPKWHSGKEFACQCRRRQSDLIPGQEDPLQQEIATHFSIPAGKSHGQRGPADYSPQGHKESLLTEQPSTQTQLMVWCGVSPSVMFDSLRPHGLQPARLFCPLNCPGKNTGVGCHSLLQGIFPTQGSNLGLLHRRQILYLFNYRDALIYSSM